MPKKPFDAESSLLDCSFASTLLSFCVEPGLLRVDLSSAATDFDSSRYLDAWKSLHPQWQE